jgi:hypothetical protein
MDTKDHGIIPQYGDGPGQCDKLGARDLWYMKPMARITCTAMRLTLTNEAYRFMKG